jgi:hypothetical protein
LSQTLPVPRKSYYQSVYCSYTAGTSLWEQALLHNSRKAANDFDAK